MLELNVVDDDKVCRKNRLDLESCLTARGQCLIKPK